MVAPITSQPCSTSKAAASDESTPPLIATRTFPRLGTPERRAELADPRDDPRESHGDGRNVGGGGIVAQGKADRSQRERALHADGGQYMRRFDGTSRAGRPAGTRDAGQVEVHQERLAFGAGH